MKSSSHSPEFPCPPLRPRTPQEPSGKENGLPPHDRTVASPAATRGSSSRRSWFFPQASRPPRGRVLQRTVFQTRRYPLVVDTRRSALHYSCRPSLIQKCFALPPHSTVGWSKALSGGFCGESCC